MPANSRWDLIRGFIQINVNLLEKLLSTVYFKDVRFPWITLYIGRQTFFCPILYIDKQFSFALACILRSNFLKLLKHILEIE